MASETRPISKIFSLPLHLGSGTRNEAPIFDRHGELVGECVDDDCEERAGAFIRATNCHDDILAALEAAENATAHSNAMAGAYPNGPYPKHLTDEAVKLLDRAQVLRRAAIAKASA